MKRRLIDADSVTLDLPMYNSFSVGMPLEERLKIMLERQPTVDAIPVELIKKKLLSCQYEYENDYDKGFDKGWNCAIKTLLKDWEKENETRVD